MAKKYLLLTTVVLVLLSYSASYVTVLKELENKLKNQKNFKNAKRTKAKNTVKRKTGKATTTKT